MEAEVRPAARTRALPLFVVGAVIAIPLLVLVVRIVHGSWLTFSDWASIELRTRDVGTAHTPLVGPYSRFGWNHPGPLLFYALALPYRLLGANGTGLLLGAVIINAIAVALIGVVLWQRGRLAALLLGSAVALLLARALGGGFLLDPWNPYVIVVPMLAVALLAWAATQGNRWALPVAVALGSFAVQSHVGAALGVVAPIAVALAFTWRDWRKLWPALVVFVVCWIPPLVQELQPHGGNLSTLVRYWTHSHPNVTGWSTGARIVAPQLSLPAPWFTGHSDTNAFGIPGWKFPFALVLLIGALVVAIRRRDRESTVLDTLALALAAAAWISASRIVDTPYDYVVQWMWIVGAVSWLAIFWTAWRALPRDHGFDSAVAITGGVVVAVLAVWLCVSAVHASFPVASDERSLSAIAPAARTALRALPQPVLIDYAPDIHSGTMAAGLLTLAIDAGVDARAPTHEAYVVGGRRTVDEQHAKSIVTVALDDAATPFAHDPRYRLLASYDPLTPAERAERDALAQELHAVESQGLDALNRWLDTHPRERARAAELDGRGPLIALFVRSG